MLVITFFPRAGIAVDASAMGDIRDRVWEGRLNAELSTLYYQERAARAAKVSRAMKALSSLFSATSVTSFVAALGASQWALGVLGTIFGVSVTIINGVAIWRDEDAKTTDFAKAYGGWSDQLSQWRIQWGRLELGDHVSLDTVEQLDIAEDKLDRSVALHGHDERLRIKSQLTVLTQLGLEMSVEFRRQAKAFGLLN